MHDLRFAPHVEGVCEEGCARRGGGVASTLYGPGEDAEPVLCCRPGCELKDPATGVADVHYVGPKRQICKDLAMAIEGRYERPCFAGEACSARRERSPNCSL